MYAIRSYYGIQSINEDNSNIIKLDENCFFDTFNSSLKYNDELIKLRAKEIDLLQLLIKNKNRFVTYEEIENHVWQDSVMTKDALKTLIKNIKQNRITSYNVCYTKLLRQVIVLSAFSNKEYLFEAIELQLVKYLIKPIKENELKKALESCIQSINEDDTNIIKLDENCFFDTFNST